MPGTFDRAEVAGPLRISARPGVSQASTSSVFDFEPLVHPRGREPRAPAPVPRCNGRDSERPIGPAPRGPWRPSRPLGTNRLPGRCRHPLRAPARRLRRVRSRRAAEKRYEMPPAKSASAQYRLFWECRTTFRPPMTRSAVMLSQSCVGATPSGGRLARYRGTVVSQHTGACALGRRSASGADGARCPAPAAEWSTPWRHSAMAARWRSSSRADSSAWPARIGLKLHTRPRETVRCAAPARWATFCDDARSDGSGRHQDRSSAPPKVPRLPG